MIRENINKKQFLQIIKSLNGDYVYNDNGRMIKFDIKYLNEMKQFKNVFSAFGDINPEQIEWLSNIQVRHSHLPQGVMYFDRVPVGVIYPYYFSGYNNLFHLTEEDSELLLDNLRSSIENNLELIDNGVVNYDFAAKNVLYSGKHVELIDLNGRHIKRGLFGDYSPAYSYFIPDIYKILTIKLIKLYGSEETKRILSEIKKMTGYGVDRETPNIILDNVEKMRVLK